MKKRIRLTDLEAKSLGLKLNTWQKGRAPQYSINSVQYKEILRCRGEDNVRNNSDSKPNDYEKKEPFFLSALCRETNTVLGVEDFCKKYNQPFDQLSSWKFLPHHYSEPSYNMVFKESLVDDKIDIEHIRDVLTANIRETYEHDLDAPFLNDKEGVLKWADLHFGAHIRNLILTKDYDSSILEQGLMDSVSQMNAMSFRGAHVHINGDLIESFSGLNHINSWMSLDKDQIGSNAVMLCCELLDRALSNIKNLKTIKIVAGNHDRVSKNNDEDVKGGAAELIAWGLKLKGYDVEFHPYIITHLVDGINHINLHGDKGISKRSTKDIIWDYGIKGKYNFIFEAHLHSLIEKLSVTQRDKFRVMKDDGIDHRRMHLQSFFTGNYYSETLNFNSNAGYCIVSDNGKGLPNLFSFCS